jgi:hypothetical protein
MQICQIEEIIDKPEPPTQQAIEVQRKKQLEALSRIRRILLMENPSAQ